MGCGSSNLLDNDEFKKKHEARKCHYEKNHEYGNKIFELSENLRKKIKEVFTLEDLDELIKEEVINIYSCELSSKEGKQCIYTLAAKEFLERNLFMEIDVDRTIKNEFLIFQSYEEEEIPEIEEIIDGLKLPNNANILYYNGDIYIEPFLEYVIDNNGSDRLKKL